MESHEFRQISESIEIMQKVGLIKNIQLSITRKNNGKNSLKLRIQNNFINESEKYTTTLRTQIFILKLIPL